MKLTGKQLNLLCDVVCDAYTKSSLTRVVRFELDESLANIVAEGAFRDVVFELLSWAEQNGRVEALVRAVYKHNQTQPALKQFVAQHLGEEVLAELSAESPTKHNLPTSKSNLLEALYPKIREVEQLLLDLADFHNPLISMREGPPVVAVADIVEQMRTLQNVADQLTIYVSAELNEKVQQVCETLNEGIRSLTFREKLMELKASNDKIFDVQLEAMDIVMHNLPSMRSELESDLRTLLRTN